MKKTYEEKKKAILSQNKHYINAVLYIGGVYILMSVICLWFDLAEDALKRAGGTAFDFKFEFNALKRVINRFEINLRKYVVRKQEMMDEMWNINGRLEEILDEAKDKMTDYMNNLMNKEIQQ